MDVFVGGSQGDALHVHTDWDSLSLIRAAVHHLVLNKSFSLSLGGGARSESLLPYKGDFHAFDFDFDQMEVDSSHNDVFEVIEGLIILEVYVKTILNSHFHLHRHNLSSSLNLFVRQQHSEIHFFHHIKFPSNNHSDEISDSTGHSIESLIFFFEVGKLELVGHVLS